MERDAPASQRVRAFEVELVSFLHELLAITPFVYSVLQVRIEDFHGCAVRSAPDTDRRAPTSLTISDQDTTLRESRVRKLPEIVRIFPALTEKLTYPNRIRM